MKQAKQPNQPKKYMRLCFERWDKWRQDGHEPASRSAALTIIKRELAVVHIDFETSDLRKGLAVSLFEADDSREKSISSNLSYVVWDLTQNDGKALDYDVNSNYFSGLLQQAGWAITQVRQIVAVQTSSGERRISVPISIYVKGRGRETLVSQSPAKLEELAEAFIEDAKAQLIRWRALGANVTLVKRALRKLTQEVLKAYEFEPAPGRPALVRRARVQVAPAVAAFKR